MPRKTISKQESHAHIKKANYKRSHHNFKSFQNNNEYKGYKRVSSGHKRTRALEPSFSYAECVRTPNILNQSSKKKFRKRKEVKSGRFEYLRDKIKKNMKRSEYEMEYRILRAQKRKKNSKILRNPEMYLSKGKPKRQRNSSKSLK